MTKHGWAVGDKVKVGFMQLTVLSMNTDGVYTLKHSNGKLFTFKPYWGIERIA
jgi:hypothetical protein